MTDLSDAWAFATPIISAFGPPIAVAFGVRFLFGTLRHLAGR